MSYTLVNLQTCAPCPRPPYIPVSRPRGVKGKGLSFERKVGKLLKVLYPKVYSGIWFEYRDGVKSGVCQIDHFVVLRSKVLLFECKLSEKDEAWGQMRDLYAPILEKLYRRPVARIQVCRYIRSTRRQVHHPDSAPPSTEALWHVLV